MSPVAERPPKPAVRVEPVEDRPFAITAGQFFAMIEAGVFPEEARVYLQDGRIMEKMAKSRPHSWSGGLLATRLARSIPAGYLVMPEGEFQLDEWNAKLPDLAVVRCDDPRAAVANRAPLRAEELALALEIAVSSLSKDLGENLERYARALVPNYWVADILGRRLFVHTEPRVVEGRGVYSGTDVIIPGGAFSLTLHDRDPIRFAYEDLMA